MSNHLHPELALSILSELPIPIVVSNEAKQLHWYNQAFAELGVSLKSDIQNLPVQEVLNSIFSPVDNRHKTVCTTLGADNQQRWYEQKKIELSFDNHNYIVYIFADDTDTITSQLEYGKLNKRLEELTTIEPISGLLNTRAMMQSLEPLISRSRRYENPLSVIAIELINLHQLVEQLDKENTDKAIISMSYLLRDQLRWADIVSRIDDTRLLIVLPETEQTDALFLANKIMTNVSDLEIENDNQVSLRIDTCYGVSSWKKGNDSQLLLKHAYQALAQAVEKGARSIIEG